MFSSISKYSNNRTASIKRTFCMACNEGQFDGVELIVNNNSRIYVSIWMLNMWMEWLILIMENN